MIRWSPRGKQRLLGCMRYIAEQSQDWPIVINWRDRVYEAVEHLEDFPEAGTVVRELNRNDIRQVIVGDYRVIYRVKRRTPEIIWLFMNSMKVSQLTRHLLLPVA